MLILDLIKNYHCLGVGEKPYGLGTYVRKYNQRGFNLVSQMDPERFLSTESLRCILRALIIIHKSI